MSYRTSEYSTKNKWKKLPKKNIVITLTRKSANQVKDEWDNQLTKCSQCGNMINAVNKNKSIHVKKIIRMIKRQLK